MLSVQPRNGAASSGRSLWEANGVSVGNKGEVQPREWMEGRVGAWKGARSTGLGKDHGLAAASGVGPALEKKSDCGEKGYPGEL